MGNNIVTRIISHSSFDLLELHKKFPNRYPHYLESLQSTHASSRFNILFAHPTATISLNREGLRSTGDYTDSVFEQNGFLEAFEIIYNKEAASTNVNDLPFHGGWFLYLGYELVSEVESKLSSVELPKSMPTAYAVRHPAAIIVDQHKKQLILVAESEYAYLIDEMLMDLQQTSHQTVVKHDIIATHIETDAEDSFLNGVVRIKNYIRDGDIFQANLSREWRIDIADNIDSTDIYAALRKNNPSPFAGISVFNDTAIISSSPERLVSVKNGVIQTRPIAGTRPRSLNKEDDDAFAATLLQHPKERAEHIMLIDLERNDLGRVSQYGTVVVDELMILESYQHVHHIVSNVRGELRSDVNPVDVIKAIFPGGTITGCPKIHCMEILAELEQKSRGAYTGSFGYLNRDGSMDLNILIRSIVKQGHKLSIRAGAGIVADSEPENELQETCSKAKGMLKAIGVEI